MRHHKVTVFIGKVTGYGADLARGLTCRTADDSLWTEATGIFLTVLCLSDRAKIPQGGKKLRGKESQP